MVEDKDSLRTMLRLALERQGYSVVEACDEPQARAALAAALPAVVLSDLRLPDGDGFGVLRAAKDADPDTLRDLVRHAGERQDLQRMLDKARELARILTRYQYRTRLLLVPFGTLQQTIVAEAPAPLRVVLYRRFMVRIAEALAPRLKAKALVTGESLGQVASQTLDNMAAIDEAARGPVLRPLVGLVILDEVQRRPDLFPLLRVLADRPSTPARFLMLGSASPALVKEGSESLAGRVSFIDVTGFSLAELGADALSRLWWRGGFPRALLASDDAAVGGCEEIEAHIFPWFEMGRTRGRRFDARWTCVLAQLPPQRERRAAVRIDRHVAERAAQVRREVELEPQWQIVVAIAPAALVGQHQPGLVLQLRVPAVRDLGIDDLVHFGLRLFAQGAGADDAGLQLKPVEARERLVELRRRDKADRGIEPPRIRAIVQRRVRQRDVARRVHVLAQRVVRAQVAFHARTAAGHRERRNQERGDVLHRLDAAPRHPGNLNAVRVVVVRLEEHVVLENEGRGLESRLLLINQEKEQRFQSADAFRAALASVTSSGLTNSVAPATIHRMYSV